MRNKRGFTIIELLIVITIIMILAVMGAGAYSVGRRIAVMDAHSEKLVSLLHALRDKSKAISAATGAKCYGFIFTKDAIPEQITTPYLNNRAGCDSTAEPVRVPLNWQSDVTVKSIKTGESGTPPSLKILFSPPHGTIILDEGNHSFTIELQYKDRTRKIEINESSGRIEKVLN